MEKQQTATFIGHWECYVVSRAAIQREIVNLIEKGVTCFLSGGMGTFDWMCARIVFELKKTPYYRKPSRYSLPYFQCR